MDIKYYGNYSLESGEYIGLYPTDMHPDISSIPEPKIELTKHQWKQVISGPRYRVINGVHTESPFTEEELSKDHEESIKKQRLDLLKESDWVVLPHSPITGSKLEEWVTYRQELRDVTNQTPPYVLPTKPE